MMRAAALWLVIAVACVGCKQDVDESAESAKAEEAEKAAAGATPAMALTPPPPPAEGELAERVVAHFAAMRAIALPVTEFCDEASIDLVDYFELARRDFEATASAEFDPDDKKMLAEAYIEFAEVSARCLQDPKGKAFNKEVRAMMKPLELPLGG